MKPSPLPLGFLVAQVERSARQLVAAQVEPLGLSVPQFWTLVQVAEHPSTSQAEVAARQRVDEATTCRVVRSLADAGLLSAARDPADRRRVRLGLTPEGVALARRLVPVARAIRATVEAPLAPAEREACRVALGKVLARLDLLAAAEPGPPALASLPRAASAPRPRPGARRGRASALRGAP